MLSNKLTSFFAGIGCGLCFAPVFFLPGIFLTSILLAQIKLAKTKAEAMKFGYSFGFGFYLVTLYWISLGVSVYIEQFWWAVPLALFALPAFLALFTAVMSFATWCFRTYKLLHFIFCSIWVLFEWIMSWIFTGLPWGVIGYGLSNCLYLIQIADIFSVFGLSFFTIYIASSFYDLRDRLGLYSRIIGGIMMIASVVTYGILKIENNPTQFSNISARIVQPSIPQVEKWDPDEFWQNLRFQTELSKQKTKDDRVPDLIIWSEAALTVPYYIKPVLKTILSVLSNERQVLITGGVGDNGKTGDELEIYSSMIGLNLNEEELFEYHKAHLVPFGEYMPLKKILPLKKITYGLMDYTEGKRINLPIDKFDLNIWPLICYESIFPEEVRISNKTLDIIINITNDAWYRNSSGPYQHFEISRMRAVENGLPLIRAANNGISGFVDPVGRVLSKTNIDEVVIIDNFIPQKLGYETIFSKFGLKTMLIGLILVLILQLACNFFANLIYGKLK